MVIDFNRFKKLWLSEVLAHFEMQAFLSFGTQKRIPLSPVPRIKKNIEMINSFIPELEDLCLKHGINLEKTTWKENPWRLGHPLERNLTKIYSSILQERDRLWNEANFLLTENDWTDKSGPEAIPIPFCKMILVGIYASSGNKEFLRKYSSFIQTGGSFDRLLRQYRVKRETREILFKMPDKDLGMWRKKTKQTMERKIISYMTGKDIKSFKLFPQEYEKMKTEIEEMKSNLLFKIKN